MILFIDFETRSRADLKKGGLYLYAEHPSTQVTCLSVKEDDKPSRIWIPQYVKNILGGPIECLTDEDLARTLSDAEEIHAFNAAFERLVYYNYMHKKLGFPAIPFHKWRCTAAKAASYALPRALGNACSVLHLSEQKDNTGKKIMMKLCKPKRDGSWNEDPADFEGLIKYCLQDTEAERSLDKALPDMPESEVALWQLDQKINDTGIYIDKNAVSHLLECVEHRVKELTLETQKITGGMIKSPRQVTESRKWLESQGVFLKDLTKDTVNDALALKSTKGNAARLLEIRRALAKSSVAKLKTMLGMSNDEGRIRGTMLYHGASTGRWSGKGVQPHNFPRTKFGEKEIDLLTNTSPDMMTLLNGCVMHTASNCLRGMICAPEGSLLMCADYASIEARVLAWVAGQESILRAFREGRDLYKVNAADIFNTRYEEVTPEQRQIGKVAELALGYQGWVNAFATMGKNYGVTLEEDVAKNIIMAWRDSRKSIVAFWAGVNSAAVSAVKTGNCFSYGPVKFGMRRNFLHCRLPSGRLLSYYAPTIQNIVDKFGRTKECITLKWARLSTYGGKLTENIVQATARDILADALLRVAAAGMKITMHVHDEIVVETPDEGASKNAEKLKQFNEMLSVTPQWAAGCPITATGWIGKRYRKD